MPSAAAAPRYRPRRSAPPNRPPNRAEASVAQCGAKRLCNPRNIAGHSTRRIYFRRRHRRRSSPQRLQKAAPHLDFVLTWSGGTQKLRGLNLAVLSPNYSTNPQDFVTNPPFTVSLNPNDPANVATAPSPIPKPAPTAGQSPKTASGREIGIGFLAEELPGWNLWRGGVQLPRRQAAAEPDH